MPNTTNLGFVLDGVPYEVKITPEKFNTDNRYRVVYGDAEYLFAYDNEIGRYAALDSASTDLPDVLEEAIAERVENIG